MSSKLMSLFQSLISALKPFSKSSPTPPQSTSTFHFFPLLPAEIRSQIWDLAIPHPRLVFIPSRTRYIPPKNVERYEDGPPPYYFLRRLQADMTIESCYGVPATLHVCSESRDIAQRFYEKAWEKGEGISVVDEDVVEDTGEVERVRRELGWRYSWVNYTLDVIAFDHA